MYDELLPGERRSLHRAFAEALETQAIGSGASEAGHWAELAHHWAAAREDTRAFAASLKAADAAMSAFAFRAALQEYERALELWDGGSDGDERPPFDRVELLRLAGLAAYLAADYRRAVAHRREALAEVRPDEDPVRVGMLQEQLGRALWLNGDSSAALEAYRTAVATIPDQPPSAERARAVSGLGQILMLRSRHEESRILCEEAIAIARAVGARAEEGHALNTLGLDLASLGDAERGLEALREALRIARDAHNADDTGRAYVNLAESLDRAGDTAGALALASEGIRVTEELGVAHSYGYFIRMDAAAYAHLVGDWAEARRLMAEAATRVPSGAGAELYRLTRTLPVFVGEGSFDVADAGLRRVFELITDNPDAEYIGPAYAAAAERELWRHAPAAALDLVEAGMERLSATDDRFETSQMSRLGAWAAGDLAEEALAARDEARLAAARARFHRLRAQVEGLADGVAGPRLDHELETNRALFAAEATRVEGHPDAAAWRGMAERWTALDRPYLAAYARWREAEAALATGDRATAGEALRAARSVAMELQASPLLTAVEGLARRARIAVDAVSRSSPASTRAQDADPFGLTPREREVLLLVADGRTNRQIAEALFISESTAGVHVSNILGKLGVASRVEAAGIAFRLQLVSADREAAISS
jgi:DNA-binding CsgD family transcriptional regulator/tetratricopeptide (TPR) repeat protein